MAALQRTFEQQGLPAPELAVRRAGQSADVEVVAESHLVGFVSRQVRPARKTAMRVVELTVRAAKEPSDGMSYRKNAICRGDAAASWRSSERLRNASASR